MSRPEGLSALVAVVEHGSFSAAAERLGIAKSAVSRRVKDLEPAWVCACSTAVCATTDARTVSANGGTSVRPPVQAPAR